MTSLLTLTEAAAQIRWRRLSPLDLVDACLARIQQYDDRIRAWVVVDAEEARQTARQMGHEAEQGIFRGPLHGIPIGVKDIIDVAGFVTGCGSPLRAERRASADAPLVAALRAAGAIILGKTVTVQFAAFDPPPTRNPWDPLLGHTPGGSSSGSAAALAMGMCLGAVGTQTGGSLVRPASYCGVTTCKPTFGRISTEGVVPLSHHLDHPGPMARTVADVEVMLRCLIDLPEREKGTGTFCAKHPKGRSGKRCLSPFPAPRLGLVETFFMERADAAVRAAVAASVGRWRDAGAIVEPVRLAIDFQEILDLHWRIMAVEGAAYHRADFAAHRNQYGPMITSLLDEGLTISAVDYAAALAHQRELRRRIGPIFAGFDALVMPSTDTPAPPRLDTTGQRDFQAPWSYAGVPVVSIPCALAPDGMPVAIQFVQRHDQEATLLGVAQWCEAVLDFRHVPSMLT